MFVVDPLPIALPAAPVATELDVSLMNHRRELFEDHLFRLILKHAWRRMHSLKGAAKRRKLNRCITPINCSYD